MNPAWAYAAMLAAMLISSGNFIFGNLAVDEVQPLTLTFWRSAIGAACLVPIVLRTRRDLQGFWKNRKAKVLILTVLGVVLPPWFIYLSLRSDNLIDLSIGYTFIPLMAAIFSAFLLAERLSRIQYFGLTAAFLGAMVFAFRGDPANLANFDPHVGFLWMLAVCLTRSLYLVLLKRWDIHPAPDQGLFILLALGTLLTLPGFLAQEAARAQPLTYSYPVWGSILFIGIGMGAVYLHLIGYGTKHIGATHSSLFTYTVPIFVTIESVLFLNASLHAYQLVGALFVVGGVFLVSRFRHQEARLHPH